MADYHGVRICVEEDYWLSGKKLKIYLDEKSNYKQQRAETNLGFLCSAVLLRAPYSCSVGFRHISRSLWSLVMEESHKI